MAVLLDRTSDELRPLSRVLTEEATIKNIGMPFQICCWMNYMAVSASRVCQWIMITMVMSTSLSFSFP
jgi:hypothetical protein